MVTNQIAKRRVHNDEDEYKLFTTHIVYGNIYMHCMFPKSVIGLKLTNKNKLQLLRAFSLNED
jgi:hypothetical protein